MDEKKQNRSDLSSIMVIFGGTGDLTHRKLMPALYNLVHDQLMPEHFAVVSVGRRSKTSETYRDEVFQSLQKYSRNQIVPEQWARLRETIHYFQLDFDDANGYSQLKEYLSELDGRVMTQGRLVFYLAVAPEYFEVIVAGLETSGLTDRCSLSGDHAGCLTDSAKGWRRLVIEKPFGKDLMTATRLNDALHRVFEERDIYRIDHYLGKDMIQNIMVLRFCNKVFESMWNSQYIDNVQISLDEKYGVGSRGGYYDVSGAMRDMIQNHAFQILSLVAMEPPVALTTDAIRIEKLKVIQAIEEFTPERLRDSVVFGQYGPGMIDGKSVPGYREEENGVPPDSMTETFVALKLRINNFRWAGTPFYIRTGKRLGVHSAEIVIQFKSVPRVLYFKDGMPQEPNLLVIRIQPQVGVSFQLNTMDFSSSQKDIHTMKVESGSISASQGNTPEAYERLLYDILRGDATLFSWWNEVEASWRLADRIIEYRESKRLNYPNYDAGSMGPVHAFELLARDGREWWHV